MSQILKQKYTFIEQLSPCAVFIRVWFYSRFVLKDNHQEIVYWWQKCNSRMFHSINVKRTVWNPVFIFVIGLFVHFEIILRNVCSSLLNLCLPSFRLIYCCLGMNYKITKVDSHSRKRYARSKITEFVALKETRNRTVLEYHRIWHKTVLETATGLRAKQYDRNSAVARACKLGVCNLTSCVSGQTS